jgi:hypothetical protein
MAGRRKSNKGRKQVKGSLISRWDMRSGGTTSLVVPYEGVILSTGVLSFQSVLAAIWGGTGSILYANPIWGDYSSIFTTFTVAEVRVRYTPHYTASVANGAGSGLAGFFQTADLTAISPTSNMPSFRQACSNARPFYVGRAYTATWRPGGDSVLKLKAATRQTTPAVGTGYVSWGYAFEQNPSVNTTQLGNLFFEVLVRFYRA